MSEQQEEKRRLKFPKKAKVVSLILIAVIVFAVLLVSGEVYDTPEDLLVSYMEHVSKGEYEEMYAMLDKRTAGSISQESFVQRNSAIYRGIGLSDLEVTVSGYDPFSHSVKYTTSMETAAGTIQFDNAAKFRRNGTRYGLVWKDSMIFPELGSSDKIRVNSEKAVRGQIFDRNGKVLAGNGQATSVGIVPGKLEDRESAVREVAELLKMEPEEIEKKLSASWVRDEYFVPIRTIKKVHGDAYVPDSTYADEDEEKALQKKLYDISGVHLKDTDVREYPLGEAAAHLVGYLQSVTAEDLEEHKGEGYTSDSMIGRSGLEAVYEKKLKGRDACEILLVNSDGETKKTLASQTLKNGKDVTVAIDADVQEAIYKQMKEEKSCSAAMNPLTGEVLALVSTPSYDTNNLIMGISGEEWTALNDDEKKPLLNRFRQTWCPGSSFKPVIAEIGLSCDAIDPAKNETHTGLKWQKDSSWGSYYVTTLHDYSPKNLENALVYSDNIYFAKAALSIGSENLESYLTRIGFQQKLPFEISMKKSQYSNSGHIEKETQLADSGYGQGEILVNPLHLACIYTSLLNKGNILKPTLVPAVARHSEEVLLKETGEETDQTSEVKQEETGQNGAADSVWIPGAFSEEAATLVLEGTKKVVSDPKGTGHAAARSDTVLAGKTGTAEIKADKEDTTGTELGWFVLFTADPDAKRPILLLSMVEDVKNRGGSGYVVGKESQIMNWWLTRSS